LRFVELTPTTRKRNVVGYTRVETGDHVIGVGVAPDNGARVAGKRGLVINVRDHLGEDVITVEWADGTVNEVRQENVSGTQQGHFRR